MSLLKMAGAEIQNKLQAVDFVKKPFRRVKNACLIGGLFPVVFALVLSAITAKAIADPKVDENADPYQSVNRKVFWFNQKFDRYLLKPAAKTYDAVTPKVVDKGISNFFSNLRDIGNSLNSALQGDFGTSSRSFSRLLVNSTIGIGGLMDVADDFGLEEQKEDFGQTLAVWGVGEGPYVEVPFMGGRNLRDAFSLIPDWFTNPVSYVDHTQTRWSFIVADTVDRRAGLLDAEKLITGDRYTFLRELRAQQRSALINNGALIEDDFGDDFDSDEDWDDVDAESVDEGGAKKATFQF